MYKAGEASQREFTTAFQKRAMGTEALNKILFHAIWIQAQIAISVAEMRNSTQNVIDNDPSIPLESLPVSLLDIDTARRHVNWVRRALHVRQAAYDERHDPRLESTKHMRTAVTTLFPYAWRPTPHSTAPGAGLAPTQTQNKQHAPETQPIIPMQAKPSDSPKTMSVSLANLAAGGGREQEEFESLEHDADEMEGDTEASPATDGSFSSPLTPNDSSNLPSNRPRSYDNPVSTAHCPHCRIFQVIF